MLDNSAAPVCLDPGHQQLWAGGGKKRKKKTCPSLDVVAGSSEPMLEDTATKNVEEVV